MCILFCAIYTQTMLRKKNIAKKEGYSCAQNIADYLRIVLDYCLLGIYIYIYTCIYTPCVDAYVYIQCTLYGVHCILHV